MLPEIIYAGEKLEWSESNGDFPASDGWTLKYVIINASAKYTMSSTADGDAHKFEIDSATTATYGAGLYTYQRYFDKDAMVCGVSTGIVTVKPNLITATLLDTRSHARKTLDAIEATIERRATKEQSSISVLGKSLSNMSLEELIKGKNYYQALVMNEEAEERQRNGGRGKQKILLEFKRT